MKPHSLSLQRSRGSSLSIFFSVGIGELNFHFRTTN